MKSRIVALLLLPLFSLSFPVHAEEAPRVFNESAQQAPLSTAGLRALEHACKLVTAINALDWKTAEAGIGLPIGPNNPLPFLKYHAAREQDWSGIGAYRGSEISPDDGTLLHRFAYGSSRTTPHAAIFQYSLQGDTFQLKKFMLLGW